ncbi:MAG TPA: sugar ABC transporter permease [Rhodopila sp.]
MSASATVLTAPPTAPRSRQNTGEGRFALLILAPGVVVLLAVIVLPMLATMRQALFGDPGLDPATGFVNPTAPFVGLDNFRRVLALDNGRFWRDLLNTTVLAFATVLLETVIGTAMALVMNQALKARALIRVSVLIPWAIPSALSGVMWGWVLSANGIVNSILPIKVLWTADGVPALFAVIFADTWKSAPFLALLVLAGLQTIPGEVYEAARVDGAGAWRRLISITLPLVRPALVVAVLFRLLDALRMFDLPYVLIGPRKESVETLSMVSQDEAGGLHYGMAASYAIALFVFIFLIVFIFVRFLGADILGSTGSGVSRRHRRQEAVV